MRKKFKINGEIYKEGEIVEFENKRLPFKGIKRDHTILTEGLWYDPIKKEFFEEKNNDINLMKNFLKNKKIKNEFSSIRIKNPSLNFKEKEKSNERLSSDEILYFDINPDDDLMVRVLKETINNSKLTLKDVMDNLENGYNLVYGLRTRTSTKFKSMEAWAKLLNKEIKIDII
jgi:hypothetical protein